VDEEEGAHGETHARGDQADGISQRNGGAQCEAFDCAGKA